MESAKDTMQCNRAECDLPSFSKTGIGLPEVNTVYPIPVYRHENDTIRFEMAETGETRFITGLILNPYVISRGDTDEEAREHESEGLVRFSPELKFIVVEEGLHYFRVITDGESGRWHIIKKDAEKVYYQTEKEFRNRRWNSALNPRWNIYKTWERYLPRIPFVASEDMVIYDAPFGKAIYEDKIGKNIMARVFEVRGDWVRVQARHNPRVPTGWAEWRKDDRIVMDIVEHVYF